MAFLSVLLALLPLTVAWKAPYTPHSRDISGSCNAPASSSYNSSWANKLPQSVTNGGGTLGTFDQQPLGSWVSGPLPQGKPWGVRTVDNSNPYDEDQVPTTGMTRYYTWTVTNTTLAPDGVELPMLVANGQFPGPLIEANWGDWIEVNVINGLESEGTSIHWHGFLMTGTPYYDGVPAISQCPIAPGKSFTYRFRAELYGSSWWHSHFSGQYLNGLAGPIVIHGPKSTQYDIDLGPVMLSDWFHNYYINLIEQIYHSSEDGPIFPPMSNNMLIQGKAQYDCNKTNLTCTPGAGTAVFKFETGKRHLLRLINHSAEALIFFSIDGYDFEIISNDFVPVVPYTVDMVKLGVGQRTEIIVTGKNCSTEAVWMRITEGPSGLGAVGTTGCSLNDGLSYEATAAIYYESADVSIPPNTTSTIDPSTYLGLTNCVNAPLNETVPAFAMPVKTPDTTLNFLMTGGDNSSGDFVWYMNNVTFIGDYNDPALLEAKLNNYASMPSIRQIYNPGSNTTVLRVIMTSEGFPASHPMHIHGHNFQVLATGTGTWDGSTIVNAANPQRRDTQIVPPNGYLVVQYELDNPGLWPLHCHVAWHVSEGMVVNIVDRPEELAGMVFPYSVAQTCREWAEWTGGHLVDQIDSGL